MRTTDSTDHGRPALINTHDTLESPAIARRRRRSIDYNRNISWWHRRSRVLLGTSVKCVGVYLTGLLCYAGCAWGEAADFTLQQLSHRAFTFTDGAPAPIRALAQTADGLLWVGSSAGLFHFDGIHFVHYPGPADPALPSADIDVLVTAPDGGLWIGFRLGGISLLHEGQLTSYGEREGLPPGSVKAMAFDRDGTLWIGTTSGLAILRGTHLEKVAVDRVHSVVGMLVDGSGTLWVAGRDGVMARARGADQFREVSRETATSNGGQFHGLPPGFAESAPDQVWSTRGSDLARLDSSDGSAPHVQLFSAGEDIRGLLIDHSGAVWLGGGRDVKRWPLAQRLSDEQSNSPTAHVQTLGLLTGTPETFLEDREHNIWVGTSGGLDRLSLTNVVRALPECHDFGWTLVAGDEGTLWAACTAPNSVIAHMVQIRDGQVVSQHETAACTAAYRDPTGTIWFGGPTVLGHIRGGALETTPLPPPLIGFDVQALASDTSGALWVSVVRKGVYRVQNDQWVAYGGVVGLPQEPAVVITRDGAGALWLGYTNNRIARLSAAGAVRLFGTNEGLSVGNVTAIHVSLGRVWVGGEVGLARFDGTRFVPLQGASSAFNGISGIANTEDGALWLNGIGGIAHITASELEHAWRNPGYAVHSELLDSLDGVPGPPDELRPIPTAATTSDGRIWFSMIGGLIWIDPRHPIRNALPPPVTISSITSPSTEYRNLGRALHLPVHTTRLQINYSAGSLTIPEHVRFRYELEGSDRDWQDGGGRREALYTNLGPGRYTFRVIASNNDGVWNKEGAALDFSISPAFYQTGWFYALCVLLCLIMLAVLFQLRMRRVGAQIRARLEERLAERERIARELHDTLLQGVQGLIWRFQAATDQLSPDQKARQLLEQSIARADQLLAESRDRVRDLRTPLSGTAELSQALTAEGEQLAQAGEVQFTVTLQGELRELHPIVREEVFLIAREALTNAFRHSGAHHVEAEIDYGGRALQIRVRDDGCGLLAEGPASAQDSKHFGLRGMHERADRIRARLVIWSKPGSGTEIDLGVPGELAYRRGQRARG